MERIEFTADELEKLFHAALKEGDAKGVEAALLAMTRTDPHRAARLFNATKRALAVASRINGTVSYCEVPVYPYGGFAAPTQCGERMPCRIHGE